METRILEAAVRSLAAHLNPPPQVLAVDRPAAERVVILLEGPSLGGRRRLVLDVDPSHPTLHLAVAPRTERIGGGFAERLVGFHLTGVDTGSEPRVRRFLFAGRRGRPPGEESGDLRRTGSAGRRGETAERWALVAEWTGRSGNLRLVDDDGQVREALLPRGPQTGDAYQGPPAAAPMPAPQRGSLAAILAKSPPEQWPRLIARLRLGISRAEAVEAMARGSDAEGVAREVLSMRPSPPGAPSAPSTPGEPQTFHLYLIPSRAEILTMPAESLGLPGAHVSDRALGVLAPFEAEDGGDVMALLARAHEALIGSAETERRRSAAIQRVRHEEARLLRLRKNLLLERGPEGEGPFLRRAGEAIVSHIPLIRRGDTELVCPDWPTDTGEPLRVPLDPSLSPQANAQAWFRRARRWERGEPHRVRRLEEIDRAVARLSELQVRIRDVDAPPDPERLDRWYREALGAARPGARGRERVESGASRSPGRASRDGSAGPSEAASPRAGSARPASSRAAPGGPPGGFRPRVFSTSEGWTVLVGRSNEENDYLTHRMAHPEDYWFHVHGASGSHVVLRREGRKDNPSTRTLEEAASIAAFYSKARHSGKVPVIYTLKKYVRKPRQSKPGLAVCTREKTLLVRPRNPARDQEPEWMEEQGQ